jgi:hypothetical protein
MTRLPQVEDLFGRTDFRRKVVDIPVEQLRQSTARRHVYVMYMSYTLIANRTAMTYLKIVARCFVFAKYIKMLTHNQAQTEPLNR